jgi:nitrite reductase/ring-hydroxylating ferredoxin subunit
MTDTTNDPVVVAASAELEEGDRLVVAIDGLEIGIFRSRGQLLAYENYCVHQGGPICQGLLISKVDDILNEHKQVVGERFSEEDLHIVCPWHGYEYNLATGVHPGDPTVRLTPHKVIERKGEICVYL